MHENMPETNTITKRPLINPLVIFFIALIALLLATFSILIALKPHVQSASTQFSANGNLEFKIATFSLTKDEANDYQGIGTITCNDDGLYCVKIHAKILSGGPKNGKKDWLMTVDVINGKGQFVDNEFPDAVLGDMEKPYYSFQIIGFYKPVPIQSEIFKSN